MPSSIYLVIGGARSGKSSHVQRLCEALTDRPIYLATAQNPGNKDWDFSQRIEKHQQDRVGRKAWVTVEEPLHLSQHLDKFSKQVVLVDCLTLWLTNWMDHEGAFSYTTTTTSTTTTTAATTTTTTSEDNGNTKEKKDQQIITEASEKALANAKQEFDKLTDPWDITFVFVTNELGSGTHGATHLTRKFVDAQGWLNQYAASKAQHVTSMVCGIPHVVKNELDRHGKTPCGGIVTKTDEALMIDKYLSSRQQQMDAKGYFLIKLDRDASPKPGLIVVSFCSCMINDKGEVCDLQGKKIPCCGDDAKIQRPESMKVWKCRTAKEVTTEIFERWSELPELQLSMGHAAYVGREAQKAEQCLYSGEHYQQD
eukprot:scaffold44905_cov183-Amphora_coffeaeformis.AAC.2